MQSSCLLLSVMALSLAAHAAAEAQVQFLGSQYIAPGTSQLSGTGLSAVLSSLLNVQPASGVDAVASQQVEQVLRPNVFARPQALLSVQVMDRPGGACAKHFAAGEGAHAATLQQGRSSGAQQVLQALSALAAHGQLQQRALGAIPGCSDICMEELLTEALAGLGGNLTRRGGPLKGAVSLPTKSAPVSFGLQGMAARLWALEAAMLHYASAEAANERQLSGVATEGTPLVYDVVLLSPRALADAHGAAAPETDAAVGALSRLVASIQTSLQSLHGDRLATHIAVVDDVPVAGSSVKGVLEWREQLQRRHLLAGASATGASTAAAIAWTVGSAAWISALLFLVFGIAACQALAGMQFKQDSLLYSRAKTE